MKIVPNPDAGEVDAIRYVVAQMYNLEEMLNGVEASHFGPDFKKACGAAYTARRYLEIELTQYEATDATD